MPRAADQTRKRILEEVGQCEQRCGRLKPLFKRLTRAGGNRARTDRGITQLRQHKRGRPSNYNSEVAWAICGRLVEGESLRRICSDAGMPTVLGR